MASAKKFFKRLGRKTAKVHKKINRVATPIVAAGASFFYGPAAGAAVTAAGAEAGRYFRATEARDKGIKGRAARSLGRGERKRVAIYGAIGTGAGTVGNFSYSLASGNTLGQAAQHALFGQHGSKLLGVEGTIFASPTEKALAAGIGPFGPLNPAVSGTQLPSSGVPGLVTQSQLVQSLAGGAPEAAGTSSSAFGPGWGTKLGTVVGQLAGRIDDIYREQRQARRDGTNPDSYQTTEFEHLFGGGGGGGGEAGGSSSGLNSPFPVMDEEKSKNGGLAAALILGALLLAG